MRGMLLAIDPCGCWLNALVRLHFPAWVPEKRETGTVLLDDESIVIVDLLRAKESLRVIACDPATAGRGCVTLTAEPGC